MSEGQAFAAEAGLYSTFRLPEAQVAQQRRKRRLGSKLLGVVLVASAVAVLFAGARYSKAKSTVDSNAAGTVCPTWPVGGRGRGSWRALVSLRLWMPRFVLRRRHDSAEFWVLSSRRQRALASALANRPPRHRQFTPAHMFHAPSLSV